MNKKIKKILIANRGEIAVRIHKTAKRLGIKTVGIYSDADANALHSKLVDELIPLGSNTLSESYLNISKIINAAVQTNSDAVHPGYGFLAENPEFPKACKDAGLIFIGPSAEAVKKMGNKTEARKIAKQAGLPMTNALTGNTLELMKAPDSISFPLLVKAAAGGGGKGMRTVHKKEDLKEAIETTRREALNYFGDDNVFIEKFIENPRHIEIQVLCDNYGNGIHLFERECSLQRRHQKIVEEAPSPTLSPEVRTKMGDAAVALCKQINYTNAGTVEFLLDEELNYYFLEMNTRIQVEHPVTELITGTDIVEQQIRIAEGEKLAFDQKDIRLKGHAIECRIYAEDPANNFNPSPGIISLYHEPDLADVRIDSSIEKEEEITGYFDPMISKLITYGKNRNEARILMIKALEDYAVLGIETNIPYLNALMQDKNYIENTISTVYCDNETKNIISQIETEKRKTDIVAPALAFFTQKLLQKNKENSVWEHIGYWRMNSSISCIIEKIIIEASFIKKDDNRISFMINEKEYNIQKVESGKILKLIINKTLHSFHLSDCRKSFVSIYYKGFIFTIKNTIGICADEEFSLADNIHGESANVIIAPMHGKIISLHVKAGDKVQKGDTLLIIEAMKMENSIKSTKDALIKKVFVKTDDNTESGKALIEFEEE